MAHERFLWLMTGSVIRICVHPRPWHTEWEIRKVTPMLSSSLPFMTPSSSGIGGRLKACPDHFVVTEICDRRTDLVDDATGSNGKHAFITLTRAQMTTQEVIQALADMFGCRSDEIGYAGLKDKCAIATQTFSLPRDRLQPV
jgi:tRNA(Glu) U13 pseudouridine synthase TruD